MKAKILSFLFILSAALLISTSVRAANSLTPQANTTEVYTVVPVNGAAGGSYAWTITTTVVGGYYTSGVGVTTLATTASNSIHWIKPGTYDFSVVWTDANSCKSEPMTWTVTVASPTVAFTTNAEAGTTCSWLYNTSPAIDQTGNSATVSTNDVIELAVTMSGGSQPIVITYEIWDVTGTATQVNSSNTYTQTVTGLTGYINVTIDKYFENETASNKNYEIRIISAVDTNSVPYTLGTNTVGTITIHAKPTMTFTGS